MTFSGVLFQEGSHFFQNNGSVQYGVVTSAVYILSTAMTFEEDNASSLIDNVGENVTISICGTNSSHLWQMISPICSTRYYSVEIFVIVAIILSVITLWTIVGNLLVLFALCRYENLHTMSNCLIGNLAVSDLLLALTVLPISTCNDLLGYWIFGEITCTIWLCIDVLYCTASIWGLCTVAFDRYLATVYPVWYHDQRSVRKAMWCIVFVWIFSIIISFAPFIGWQHMIPSFFTFNPYIKRYECILFTSSSYVLYSAMGSFVIPGILMTFMYKRIFVVLHSQSKGIKTKVPLTSTSPVYDNGYPVIRLPSDENVDGDGRDITATTLVSITTHSSKHLDEIEDNDAKIDPNHFLKSHNSNQTLLGDSVAAQLTHDKLNGQISVSQKSKLTTISLALRSNSFAIPTDAKRCNISGRNLLSVGELDRRNSHNVTIQRSTSDTSNLNVYMHDLRLSTECHRSKSASALNSDEERNSFNSQSVPRRSLPCNITTFQRNSRMTMSMKRRFELREQRATKRMLLIMVCFCVCWVPFLFMYVLRSICDTCVMNHHLVAAIIWLGYVNSSLNPVLYTLFNDDFKCAFKKLVGITTLKSRRKRFRR